jgi:hypothetical protein
LVVEMRFAGLHEIVEDIASLKPKASHDGHHSLNETTACLAVCAKASFAPQDCGPQVSLGEVVRRRKRLGQTGSAKAVRFIPAAVSRGSAITVRLPGGVAVEVEDAAALPVEWLAELAQSLTGTR